MSKFIKTVRRAVLASLIAGSLIPSTFAGGRFDSFRQAASQAKSSFSNRAQGARQSLGNAAQQFKSQAKSQFKQRAPGAVNTAFKKFQDAKSKAQQIIPRGMQNQAQSLKDRIQKSGIVQGGLNRASGVGEKFSSKFNQKSGGTMGGVFNRDLSSKMKGGSVFDRIPGGKSGGIFNKNATGALNSGVAKGGAYDRLKAEREMFKNGGKSPVIPFKNGNTGITGKGMPSTNSSTAMNGSRKVDMSKMQRLSFGDIVSAPADLVGSAATEVGKVLPGEVGKQVGNAGKVFDGVSKVQKGAVDGAGKILFPDPPSLPKKEKKGSTTHILTNGQNKTGTPIKSTGKAKKPLDPAFFNPDGSFKSQLPVINGSSNGTGGGFIQMFPMGKDGKVVNNNATASNNAPVTNNAPATNNLPANNGGQIGRGRGQHPSRFSNMVGQVMANLPQRGFGGGFQGGGFAPSQDFAPVEYVGPAPQMIEAAPVQQVAATEVIENETSIADLVLVDVKVIEGATQLAGPAYSLKFANQGLAATGKFIAAAIFSNDGSASPEAPKAMVEVPGMAAGATKEIVLRLPRGQSSHLVLAVDVDGTVNETDKDNNFAVIERAE